MLLAIDSGNTNIVFAIFDGQSCRAQWRSTTDAGRTADEYAVWLGQLMALKGLEAADIDAAIIATVVPQGLFGLRSLCRQYFGCEPTVVGEEGVDLGIKVLIDRPAEVGADRLVNAVAAHMAYEGPLIVIDFGTATTFDVIDGDGSYLGGLIAPGVNLSLEALHMAAAQLPLVAVDRPERVVGKSTIGAIQSGVYWGYLGLIEGLVSRIKDEFGEPMTVVATGGLASLFAGGTEAIEHVDLDLTIHGLLEIHGRQKA